jgi:fatty acid desaturase
METKQQREIIHHIRTTPELDDCFGAPFLAWPTVGVVLFAYAGFILSSYALLSGLLSPFITIPISAFFVFWSFTPLHEAVHRNVSHIGWLNDSIGSLCAQLILPGFSSGLYRYLHITHHARTGQLDDPDYKFNGTALPKRLMNSAFLDIMWTRFYFANWSTRPRGERGRFLLGLSLYTALFIVGFSSPYAVEFTLAFVLPMLLGRIILVHLFATIQHKQGVEQRHEPISATHMQDVFSSPWQRFFMFGQAQHLIHHLYPNVPWYHYDRLWHAVASKVPNETIRHSSYFNGDQKPYTPKS